jgi:hypothetical protein
MSDSDGAHPCRPTPQQIEELISTARDHPLGVTFLLDGDLGSVAATFEAHAFTVEAARDRLQNTDPEVE